MDPADAANGSRTALRQPFIHTANALASLYKQAVAAERDARDSGSRAAYMRIMEWAARRSRSSDPFTPADLMNFCSAELAALRPRVDPREPDPPAQHPPPPQTPQPQPPQPDPQREPQPQPQPQPQHTHPHQATTPVAYIPRDDPLVSDIRKLHVNPRKRQRVDISDTFVSACRDADSDNIIFASDGYSLRSRDSTDTTPFFPLDSATRNPASPTPRREPRDALITSSPTDYAARRGKNSKNHMYDKLRRK